MGSRDFARADSPPVPNGFVARNTSEYWNPPPDARNLPQAIDLEMVVDYYDGDWHLLWGEAADGPSWFDNTGTPLPIKSGQRVRITGTYVPSVGIDGKTVRVTVLAQQVPRPEIRVQSVDDFPKYDAHRVTLDAYVVRESDFDPTHVALDLLCQGKLVTSFLQLGSTEPIPQIAGRFVRVNLVYASRRDPAGHLIRIDGWIARASDILVIGSPDDDSRFRAPVRSIDQLGTIAAGESMHIRGLLQATDPAHSITLRDATGQVLIATEQPVNASLGTAVDVVGRVAGSGLEVTLRDPICRSVPVSDQAAATVADPPGAGLPKLRLADQVLSLTPEEAGHHYPVAIRAAVAWSAPAAGFYFLQDASGGIRVHRGGSVEPPPDIGTLLMVEGITVPGSFAPEIEPRKLTVLGKIDLPQPRATTLEEASTGAREGERVEMRGSLRSLERTGAFTRLDLTATTGEFTAMCPADAVKPQTVGSILKLTGICTAVTNSQHQLTGVQLWVADGSAVRIERPRSPDPFTSPSRTIESLHQFRGLRVLDQQVLVSGVVTYNRPGRFLFLQQDDTALLVLHRDANPIEPGEWIDAVGLPGRDGSRIVLRDAIYRRQGKRGMPEPLPISSMIANEATDGRLIRIRGQLQAAIANHDKIRLLVASNTGRFEAWLQASTPSVQPQIGSEIELTGIYVVDFDENRRPREFHVELRGPSDIRVIATAPWWTASRALTIAGGFAVSLLLATAWVVALRRRVRRQTEQIRAQMEKQARLDGELERAARLESLGVLAGGIAHDFNNLLTVIIANLGLAVMDDRVEAAAGDILAEAERGARRAADLTQQLLTFAKGGDPVRRAVALSDVVRESADFARHGSGVRCVYEFDPDLPPADVDRGQISRVVHNLVLNATQAMPEGGVIRIGLAAVAIGSDESPNLKPGRYVKLSVSDEGRGIAPEHLARIFEPYFSTKPKNNGLGLATVHSIVKKHLGHISVRSEQGHGTTFDVWLPVATEIPVADVQPCSAPCATTALRVLFMDDDEIIRRTAESLLRQLGHDAKIVGDGMDVVREYEAALNSGMRYDVVVLDLTVPGGLGGRAAMEILRRIDPGVRGIVSSGYSNDPVLANYRTYGFSAVVPKPYVVDDLARAIQQVAAMRVGPKLQASAPLAI